MPKQLSEAAAWRKLAEWCAEHPNASNAGLCYLLQWSRNTIPVGRMGPAMGSRLGEHSKLRDISPDGYLGSYLHLVSRRYDAPHSVPDARVMFCLFMALEAKEEAK